jgi:hypothetical protein
MSWDVGSASALDLLPSWWAVVKCILLLNLKANRAQLGMAEIVVRCIYCIAGRAQ